MLFTPQTVSIDKFLPFITVNFDGIDNDLAKAYVLDAVIQFLRDSKAQREIVCIKTEPCITSYRIPTVYRISEILAVRFFSRGDLIPTRRFNYYIDNGTFYLQETACPYADLTVEIELATLPNRSSDEVPEFIYEDWANAVVALALSKLYLITNSDWYNPTAANNQLSVYTQLVRQAKIANLTKHKPLNLTLKNKRTA